MGEIFLARLEGAAGFEKLFVIKRILPHLADDERFRAMLIAEARIASMMAHANICQVYELGETDGQLHIAMEYLEGVTLLTLLRKRSQDKSALDLGFIAGVAQQAIDALHYAHELRDRSGDNLGIVHRDVTPANLFLTDAGVIKILDFGIAKVKDVSAHTQTGTVKGKYAYMAPEQLRGTGVDRRADVFALGVVVYEMLALRRLFQRKTDYLTFRAVMEQPIMDIRRYRPDCPDALAAALTRALDRDPAARFDTARQFGSAVLDAIAPVRRPWTQGEVSDFVKMNFADDIAERSARIASAVRAGVDRLAMPILGNADEDTTEVEGDAQDFAAPRSDSSETPVDVRHLSRPSAEQGAIRASAEQAAVDEPSEPPNLGALRAVPGPAPQQPAPIVVVGRRSLVWPLVAFAMVAIAAGALVLVWQQMQNQQPTSLVITNDRGAQVADIGSNILVAGPRPTAPRARPDEPPPAAPESAAAPTTADSNAATATEAPATPMPHRDPGKTRHATVDPYRDVVRAKQVEATRCADEHGQPPPGTRLVIVVGPDGHPKRIAIEPASVDATPLGTCIKNVFKAAAFPRGDRDHELEIKLVRPA
jgi:serine/threonine-protein kinase